MKEYICYMNNSLADMFVYNLYKVIACSLPLVCSVTIKRFSSLLLGMLGIVNQQLLPY